MAFPPDPGRSQVPPPWDPHASVPGGPPPGPAFPPGPPQHQPGPGPTQAGWPGPFGPAPGHHQPPGFPPPAAPATRAAGAATGLRVLAVLLVALGLSIPFDSSCAWVTQIIWSIFAIAAAVTQLLASAGGSFGWDQRRSWLIGAVATAALALHWLLIALPSVASNSGFCLTFGTAAAVGALALAPGRRW